jgi:hypothetical protein
VAGTAYSLNSAFFPFANILALAFLTSSGELLNVDEAFEGFAASFFPIAAKKTKSNVP